MSLSLATWDNLVINTVTVWSVSCKCFLHKNWCKQQLIAVILYSHNCPSVSELQISRANSYWLFLMYGDCLITDCLVSVHKGAVFAGGLVKKANCGKGFIFLSTVWWLIVAVSCATNSGNLVSKICIISKFVQCCETEIASIPAMLWNLVSVPAIGETVLCETGRVSVPAVRETVLCKTEEYPFQQFGKQCYVKQKSIHSSN